MTERLRHASPGWRIALALAIVYVVWGSTYLAIRVMVETVPPLLGAGARFLLAGAGLAVFLAARRGPAVLRLSRREVVNAGLVGTLLLAGGNGLVTVAEQDVPSSLAALVIASVPLWVVVLRRVAGRERIAGATAAGVGIGFAGVAILLLPGSRPAGTGTLAMLGLLAAAASWASGSYLSGRLALPGDLFVSTAVQMVLGGVVMVVAGLAVGEAGTVNVSHFSFKSLAAFAYLMLIGSLVAFTAYVWLLQHAPISQVATYAYVNPLVAVVLGWAILSEHISAGVLAGAAVIVASVALVVRRESGPPGAAPPRAGDARGATSEAQPSRTPA